MYGTDVQAWKRPNLSDQIKAALRSKDFLQAWLVPFAVYFVLMFVYSFAFMQAASICMLVSGVAGVATLMCFASRNKPGASSGMSPLALSMLIATCVGTLLGLFCYDSFAIFPRFYSNARAYDNVVASEPAAAVADAGKVSFTTESYVSIAESVGYVTESGYIYCVAPIRDSKGMARIEFWASGIGCCSGKGDFTCDSALDKSAHAGSVVFDNNGFFQPTRRSLYEKARLKAMAEFGLQSSDDAMYVRWVDSAGLDNLSSYYKNQAVAFTMLTSMAFGFGFAVLAFITVPLNDANKYP